MTWGMFNTYIDVKECYFCSSMWFERPNMAWGLFNTYIDNKQFLI